MVEIRRQRRPLSFLQGHSGRSAPGFNPKGQSECFAPGLPKAPLRVLRFGLQTQGATPGASLRASAPRANPDASLRASAPRRHSGCFAPGLPKAPLRMLRPGLQPQGPIRLLRSGLQPQGPIRMLRSGLQPQGATPDAPLRTSAPLRRHSGCFAPDPPQAADISSLAERIPDSADGGASQQAELLLPSGHGGRTKKDGGTLKKRSVRI